MEKVVDKKRFGARFSISKEELIEFYIKRKCDLRETAKIFNCSPCTIQYKLMKFGIPRRPSNWQNGHEGQMGDKSSRWKGGKYIDYRGYALIRKPDHPSTVAGGYVYEHKLIAEKALGRFLKKVKVSIT